MDALMLLEAARTVGLTVTTDGVQLVVRGPQSEIALVQALATHKAEVLAVVAVPVKPAPASPTTTPRHVPDGRCRYCHALLPASRRDHCESCMPQALAAVSCIGCGGPLPSDRWLRCAAC